MVVAMSREICARLYAAIVKLRPDWHNDDPAQGAIKVVMTGSAADTALLQPHLYNSTAKKLLERRFKDAADPLKLVIVRDMWLTGFDVPCLHTMYIDKPMRDHNLMQAIARVNRVFRDKEGGLVVDYIGIAAELRTALRTYTESKGKGQPTLDAAGVARILGTSKGAVAVALSSLTSKGEIVGRGYLLRNEPGAVVIGGAVWDVKARSNDAMRLYTSNPSTIARTPGGVGRNIAENLARLGSPVSLIAAVGLDQPGRDLIAYTGEAGVDMSRMIFSAHDTGSYLAALDVSGELIVGQSDMMATDQLDVNSIARNQDVIERASVVVVDGNLPTAVIDWALAVAAAAEVTTVVEPVSVAKAIRLLPALSPAHPVFAIKPNVDELAALTGVEVKDETHSIIAGARRLQERGVTYVWVSRGANGSLLVGPETVVEAVWPAAEVIDVTGAGDAMTAGFVHGLIAGAEPAQAARQGQLAAALTVASPQTVRADLGVAFAQALYESPGVTR